MTAATQASGVGVLATVAARAADATLRTVYDVTGIAAVTDFFSDVWQTPRSTPPYPAEVLHSLVHAGGALHAAYDGPRLAGAHVAVLGTARRRRALPRRGYVRIKLKTEPGWDLGPVRAVHERFRDALPLQVDANTGYSLADAEHLCRLDEFGLLLTEEPLEEDNLYGHARLQRRIATPVCLDESLHNARDTASAVAMEACRIVNVKPAGVGGYLEARRVHDVAHAQGVPVWCGGMLETGIGRAPDLALAALPGFTLPGDTSASAGTPPTTSPSPSSWRTAMSRCRAPRASASSRCRKALRRFTTGRRDLYGG